ncbi:hypothetical protein ACUNV4_01875 [Granulosicoccus sp. 3-233]|uniref:hypothetical protein n=1 Tax=Granulosicoccus sp. 3-233 TaxID=3417969 RepID=UPI003D337D36
MGVSANNKVDAGGQTDEAFAGDAVTRKVLLVDEQAHVVRVIRHNLERCGFQVDSAETVDGAVQLMSTCRFDALISTGERSTTDIMELCKRGSELLAVHGLKDDDKAAPLMLVNCSEDADLSDSLPGFERLGQPVSLKHIVERLHEALGQPSSDLSS